MTSLEKEFVSLNTRIIANEFKRELIAKYPAFREVSVVFFQNQKLCADNSELIPGIEIDCMPPFSGG